MIGKLKRKLTILATISILILISTLVFIMNLVNYNSVIGDCDTIVDILAESELRFSNANSVSGNKNNETKDFLDMGISPEVSYESRYFTAYVSKTGEIRDIDLSKIVSVDEETAKVYTEKAMSSSDERGFTDSFRYKKTDYYGTTVLVFLDCGRKLDSFYTFLFISMEVSLVGCVAVFIVFLFISGKIVKPIADSYEKQKRFISDAGHEIKTPLTIINANIDLMELDFDEEKEELVEIRNQTRRLTELAGNLVMLSKMQESGHKINMIEYPLSDIVNEMTGSFLAPAEAKGITLSRNIRPGVTAKGAPDTIRQLISILTENAIKYSPDNSTVTINLLSNKKMAELSVVNPVKEKIKEEELKHVFDRFYRTDTSRNSETGGHGIGLSIAKAIAESNGGKIKAATAKDGMEFKISVSIPVINIK